MTHNQITLTVAFASLFNYFLCTKIVQLLIINSIFTLLFFRFRRNKPKFLLIAFVVLALLLFNLSFTYYLVNSKLVAKRLREIGELERIGNVRNAFGLISRMEGEAIKYGNEAEFLELKSRIAYTAHKFDVAEATGLKLVNVRPSNLTYSRLGNIYKYKGENVKAEQAF